MPTEGYKRNRPDTTWWLDQLKQGEDFRKKRAYQERWDTWRSYYRGDFPRDVMPVNLFFTMLRTIVPRVYFRNPSVSISPGLPGPENMALAKILERTDNKLLRRARVKREMKRSIQDTFLFGTGFLKIGFGGLHNPAPHERVSVAGRDEKMNLVEYSDMPEFNMPWARRIHPKHVISPPGAVNWETGRWTAVEVWRDAEDVRSDPRFENTRGIKSHKEFTISVDQLIKTERLIKLYEIHDLKTGQVIVIAPDHEKEDKTIFQGPDTLITSGRLPVRPLVFNEDDEFCWGIPDSKILEPFQEEINEIKTSIQKHRRASIVKILVRQGAMTTEQAERLVSEDVSAVAFMKGHPDRDVKLAQQGTIPNELLLAAQTVLQDVRETVGFSRNAFGEYNSRSGDTTATEANIVRMASEIRVDERRDMTADLLVEVIEAFHEVMFQYWTQDQVIEMVGPGGVPVWVKFRGDMLRKGRYSVKIDPDTSVPETRAVREAKAVQVYEILKTNPLIDPIQLTQYLLHNMHGVEFDDMMRALPGVGAPGAPINPGDFGQMIQQSVGQAQANPQLMAANQGG